MAKLVKLDQVVELSDSEITRSYNTPEQLGQIRVVEDVDSSTDLEDVDSSTDLDKGDFYA